MEYSTKAWEVLGDPLLGNFLGIGEGFLYAFLILMEHGDNVPLI